MVVDGRVVHHEVDPALAAEGLRVTDAEAPGSMGAIMNDAPDIYAELNTAFAVCPIVVEVPDRLAVSAPVVVAHFTASDGLLTMPRVVVRLGTDSELTVLDHHSSADVRALTLPVAELEAGPGARLRYLAVNLLGPRVWQVASQVARGAAASSTLVANVALGGDYARVRTDARLDGKGAAGDQLAAYFGEGDQMHDFRTLQDHAAPKTTSDLLFKGAVEGRARSVYSGLIRVRKEAPGTAAFQTNRNLKLSQDRSMEVVKRSLQVLGPYANEKACFLEKLSAAGRGEQDLEATADRSRRVIFKFRAKADSGGALSGRIGKALGS
jgi:Fe-S cluster assembly protein SufD